MPKKKGDMKKYEACLLHTKKLLSLSCMTVEFFLFDMSTMLTPLSHVYGMSCFLQGMTARWMFLFATTPPMERSALMGDAASTEWEPNTLASARQVLIDALKAF